jgi:hypothetical protein
MVPDEIAAVTNSRPTTFAKARQAKQALTQLLLVKLSFLREDKNHHKSPNPAERSSFWFQGHKTAKGV